MKKKTKLSVLFAFFAFMLAVFFSPSKTRAWCEGDSCSPGKYVLWPPTSPECDCPVDWWDMECACYNYC